MSGCIGVTSVTESIEVTEWRPSGRHFFCSFHQFRNRNDSELTLNCHACGLACVGIPYTKQCQRHNVMFRKTLLSATILSSLLGLSACTDDGDDGA